MAAGEPLFEQALDYDAKQMRQQTAMLLNSRLHTDLAPAVSLVSAGGGHGIIGSGDLVVTEKSGTPNMSVDVAAGSAFVRGTQGADQGVYGVTNNATVNVVIAAADATNPRKDLIVAKVRDAAYAGASNDVQITVIQGTAAASPVDPAVTEDTLVLARVDVLALATSITNARITDLRTRAYALGAWVTCTAATRPSVPYEGQTIYETDTDKVYIYDGSTWAETLKLGQWQSYTPTLAQGATTNIAKTVTYSRYTRIGRTVIFQCRLDATGTGTTNNNITVTLPITAAQAFIQIGSGLYGDGSASAQYNGVTVLTFTGGTFVVLERADISALSPIGVDPNIAVGSGDVISFACVYEAAAS